MSYNGYNSYQPYLNQQRASDGADNQYQSYGAQYSQPNTQSTPYAAQLPSVGQQRNTYQPPSRPSSGQNYHTARSQSNSVSNPSPGPASASAYQPPEPRQSQSYTPAPQQQRQQSSWAGSNQYPYPYPATYPATQNSYQRSSYIAPHANAHSQQQSQSPSQPSNYPATAYGDPSRYSGIENSGTAAYQNPRTDYSYTGARSPENTTALGSLAYASSLRQDRSGSGAHTDGGSLQRVADYNRATPVHVVAQRPDSRSSGVSHSNHSAPNNSRSNGHGPREGHEHQASGSQNPQNRLPPSASSTSNVTQFDSHRSGSTSSNSHQTARRTETEQPLRLPSINDPTNNQDHTKNAHQKSVSTNPTYHNPTTIDPNKVFNEYEYQKRQAAIAAEAKANREKAEAQAKQAEQAAASKTLASQDEAAMKEQMETEMKLMLEKMRDYKSKDPGLFSQIWEQVKKAQPPTALPASKEVSVPSPRASIASPQINGAAHQLSTSTLNAAQPDPNSQLVQQSASPAAEEDRGKFPAARRRGKLYKTRPSLEQPASQARPSSPPHPPGPPAGYVHAGDEGPSAPTADQSDGYVPAGNLDHNDNRPMQKVWVSGKGRTQGLGRPKGSTPKKGQAERRDQADKYDQVGRHDGAGDESVVPTNNHVSPANSPAVAQPMAATKPLPPRPTGQTHWPEDDKWALAIAARDTLLSHPANRGKQLLSEDIRNLLDQGPSYEELCGILEEKGFVVERTPFAQQLLSAVPRLKQQRPPPTAQSPIQSPTTYQPDQRKLPGQGVLVPVAHMYDNFRNAAVQAPVANMSATTAKAAPFARRQGALPKPQSRATPFNTKEQHAKKRTFNEIVDLTAGMDSDEELDRQRAEKQQKIESMKSLKTIDTNRNIQKKTDEEAKRSSPPSGGQSSAVQSDEDVTGLARFKNVMSPERERLRKAREIVRPMNRALALRRSTYNPRTIARDILVAAGKHPVMAPLNYHLEGLKTKFRHVEATSDLSTFNWPIIDPGGPPQKRQTKDIEPQAQDVETQDEPAALSASSKRPEVRIGVPNSADRKSAIATSKPAKPSKGFFAKRRSLPHSQGFMRSRPSFGVSPSQPQAPSGPRVFQDAGDVSMLGAGEGSFFVNKKKGPGSNSAPTTPQNSPAGVTQSGIGSSGGPSGHRRRGRPPGARNRNAGNVIAYRPQPKPIIPDFTTPDPKSTPGRLLAPSTFHTKSTPSRPLDPSIPDSKSTPGRLLAHPNPDPGNLSLNAMSAANARKFPSTPARPSGLRNELTVSPAAGFAVVIPSPPKRAGQASRPGSEVSSKKPARNTSSPAPIPKRQVYRCRWQDCLAELHNLETLRKHVRKHMDEFEEDNDYECLWAGCGNSRIGATGTDEREPLHFKSAITWERHMDGRHLDQYAWDLGDGPSPHPSG